jgi:hypothetical protein
VRRRAMLVRAAIRTGPCDIRRPQKSLTRW